MAQLTDILPKDYGYVALAVAGGSFVNIRHMFAVTKARKEFNVEVPLMSSEEHEAFNRVMRAHLNYLEHYPFFVSTILLGGLQHPRLCAGAGFVWLISRIIYSNEYTKDKSQRHRGFIPSYACLMVLLGCTISFGMRHSGIVTTSL